MKISCSIMKIIFIFFVYCDKFSFPFQLLRSEKTHGNIKKSGKPCNIFYIKEVFL